MSRSVTSSVRWSRQQIPAVTELSKYERRAERESEWASGSLTGCVLWGESAHPLRSPLLICGTQVMEVVPLTSSRLLKSVAVIYVKSLGHSRWALHGTREA